MLYELIEGEEIEKEYKFVENSFWETKGEESYEPI
jgi:hypothetical protein